MELWTKITVILNFYIFPCIYLYWKDLCFYMASGYSSVLSTWRTTLSILTKRSGNEFPQLLFIQECLYYALIFESLLSDMEFSVNSFFSFFFLHHFEYVIPLPYVMQGFCWDCGSRRQRTPLLVKYSTNFWRALDWSLFPKSVLSTHLHRTLPPSQSKPQTSSARVGFLYCGRSLLTSDLLWSRWSVEWCECMLAVCKSIAEVLGNS